MLRWRCRRRVLRRASTEPFRARGSRGTRFESGRHRRAGRCGDEIDGATKHGLEELALPAAALGHRAVQLHPRDGAVEHADGVVERQVAGKTARDAHGDGVRVEGGSLHLGRDFAGVRVHRGADGVAKMSGNVGGQSCRGRHRSDRGGAAAKRLLSGGVNLDAPGA